MQSLFRSKDSVLSITDQEFLEAIKAYKIPHALSPSDYYLNQHFFNTAFEINSQLSLNDDSQIRSFLQKKLDDAFQNKQELIQKYNFAQDTYKPSESHRSYHDAFHGASVALTAKYLLEFYQKNQNLFNSKIQSEIKEFENPQKIKDLEILCLMHDIARTNDKFDQDEYKNAFYLAILLRKLGDERFQGQEISQEGLDLIMNLANKERDNIEEKSLTSKLIQSADCLAILRIKKIIKDIDKFNIELMDTYKDVTKIHPDFIAQRDFLIKTLYGIVRNIHHLELTIPASPKLEISQTPADDFRSHHKIKEFIKVLDMVFHTLTNASSFESLEKIALDDEYFVHVYAKDKILERPKMFINATLQIFPTFPYQPQAVIRHMAESKWQSLPFLIIGKKQGIFISGFLTDVQSNILLKINRDFNSDIERSMAVCLHNKKNFNLIWYPLSTISFSLEALKKRLIKTNSKRRGLIADISEQRYWLVNQNGDRIKDKIGVDRYGIGYSKPQRGFDPVGSSELRHNECHVLCSVHIFDYLAITKEIWDRGYHIIIRREYNPPLPKEACLAKMKRYQRQINAEKKRLLELSDPMKDESFRKCVDFELRRVTNVFEKIILIEEIIKEINGNPQNEYWISASTSKKDKKTLKEGYKFEVSEENRVIWTIKKTVKLNHELTILHQELKEYQKSESLGFDDLSSILKGFSSHKDLKTKHLMINQWKEDILEGRIHNPQLLKAQEKVIEGLRKKTQFVVQNFLNPQELGIIDTKMINAEIAKSEIQGKSLESFRYLIANGFFENIFLTFSIQEIKKNFAKIDSSIDFENFVFRNFFKTCQVEELEEMIENGLDIFKVSSQDNIFLNSREAKIDCYQYSLENKNPDFIKKLAEYGLFMNDPTKFRMTKEFNKDFYETLQNNDPKVIEQITTIIKDYLSNHDLTIAKEIVYQTGEKIKLNAYGILRIFHNNLIKSPDQELQNLVDNLELVKNQIYPRCFSSQIKSSGISQQSAISLKGNHQRDFCSIQ
jgi:hypothetical protein